MAADSRDTTFSFTMSAEGDNVVSFDQEDNGNWSSNEAGVGRFIGSKYGVSASDLIAYMRSTQPSVVVTQATMASITKTTAEAIWTPGYWTAMRCPDLVAGVDLMTADHGYNRGTHSAGKVLQLTAGLTGDDVDGWIGDATISAVAAAIGSNVAVRGVDLSVKATKAVQRAIGVPDDGEFGPGTKAALSSAKNRGVIVFCARLADKQVADYRQLAQFGKYGNGWLSRVWSRLDDSLILTR